MEKVLEKIDSGDEAAVKRTLSAFNEKNKAKFQLGEATETRKRFCQALLRNLSTTSPGSWSLETKALGLTALRILAREREGTGQLTSKEGLEPIVELADLSKKTKESCFASGDRVSDSKVQVLIEAVKCLCNIVLTNQFLVPACADLGCLRGLSLTLALCRSLEVPHDVIFFNLRLLFLITACGPAERVKFRDDWNGLPILLNLMDTVLFGREEPPEPVTQTGILEPDSGEITAGAESQSGTDIPTPMGVQKSLDSVEAAPSPQTAEESEKKSDSETDTVLQAAEISADHPAEGPKSNFSPSLAPLRDSVYCLSAPLSDQQLTMLSEILKIVFNQTVHWKEYTDYDDEEVRLFTHLTHLVRVLLLSVPVSQSKAAGAMVAHSIEVLVNIPQQCSSAMFLAPHVHVMPVLNQSFPKIYPLQSKAAAASGGGAAARGKRPKEGELYCANLDEIFDDWNLAAIVVLLNFLHVKLHPSSERHSLSPVLSALRSLSKGHRSIRRYLKFHILPPLHEVTQRPDEGDTLKSRVVQLMTASSTHGAEDITAEFLFVLCKENATRLIKHTGYGNAAGLLLSHGLLSGGRSEGEAEYSSDSETSDTEEYQQSQPHIDPVTGGPSTHMGESPLDHMTEEEKESEAGKLQELLHKLDQHGIIKVMSLDQQQKPVVVSEVAKESDSSGSEDDDG